MAIRSARAKTRTGFTLVDTLLSSALAALILTTLMTVMISNTSAAQKEIGQLILYNRVSETLRFLQDELRRANNVDGLNLSANQLSYSYQGSERRIQSIVKADLNEEKLKYCSEVVTQSMNQDDCSRFYSMFDSNQIRLINFIVNQEQLSSNAGAPFITISLTAALVNKSGDIKPHEPLTMTMQVSPRN